MRAANHSNMNGQGMVANNGLVGLFVLSFGASCPGGNWLGQKQASVSYCYVISQELLNHVNFSSPSPI
jgi:hypothetical protein